MTVRHKMHVSVILHNLYSKHFCSNKYLTLRVNDKMFLGKSDTVCYDLYME